MSEFFIRPYSDNSGYYYTKTGSPVKSKYNQYACKEDYERDNIQYIVPMRAYEAQEGKLEELFNSSETIVDEKIDGLRGIMHILDGGEVRVFTRGVSKTTGWLGELTDKLPQFQCLEVPEELYGTILDGELVIPDFDCGTISGCMNALPELAIDKQYNEHGFAVFRAFDIIELSGADIRDERLLDRKKKLTVVSERLNSEWIKPLKYFNANKKEYYEEVVKAGGEGVMLKDINSAYQHKKCRAYQKVKAKMTRDLIITGFSLPTREYTGKFPDDYWSYWEDAQGNLIDAELIDANEASASDLLSQGNTPVTKHYYFSQVGNIQLAVISPTRTTNKMKLSLLATPDKEIINTIDCGECAGISDADRQYFTDHKEELIGTVVEVECNEVFKETGKMRHPRYLRLRTGEKDLKECTWGSHIGG